MIRDEVHRVGHICCEEIDRLRAELVERDHAIRDMRATLGMVSERRDSAEARIAAVLALCDQATPPHCRYDEPNECGSHCDCGWGELWHESVRAAATGDTK